MDSAKARIVVLEGPDGGGKTTLAQSLVKNHGYRYVHVTAPKPGEDVLNTYATLLYAAHKDGKDIVFDRLHLGEFVYGDIFRGSNSLGREGLHLILRLVNAYDVRVFVCLPPFGEALKNWKAKKEDFAKTPAKYAEVYEYFERMIGTYNWGYPSSYDYTRHPDPYAKSTPLTLPPEVVGAHEASFLFVGDQANHPNLDVPFMSLSGSSHYLYECLHAAGFREREMRFMNARKISGELNSVLAASRGSGNRLSVVALGGRAAKVCSGAVFSDVSHVPHPAYWKRFHSGETEIYINFLKEIRAKAARD